MGVGSGFYVYDVVVKRSRSLSHLLVSSCGCLPVTSFLALIEWVKVLRHTRHSVGHFEDVLPSQHLIGLVPTQQKQVTQG